MELGGILVWPFGGIGERPLAFGVDRYRRRPLYRSHCGSLLVYFGARGNYLYYCEAVKKRQLPL